MASGIGSLASGIAGGFASMPSSTSAYRGPGFTMPDGNQLLELISITRELVIDKL